MSVFSEMTFYMPATDMRPVQWKLDMDSWYAEHLFKFKLDLLSEVYEDRQIRDQIYTSDFVDLSRRLPDVYWVELKGKRLKL